MVCGDHVYSRDELVSLRLQTNAFSCKSGVLQRLEQIKRQYSSTADSGQYDDPGGQSSSKQTTRKRGKCGGTLVKLRQQNQTPQLPSNFFANVRSLRNKVDELSSLMFNRKDYRDCSLYCFTESWLDLYITESAINIPDFTTFRADNNFVNNLWCANVKVLSNY